MGFIVDFILNIDKHLVEIVQNFGNFTYFILFAIVFVETGLVVFPFLPGDSLLFVAGTLSTLGSLNIIVIYIVFLVAAILGDTVNYEIGKHLGTKLLSKEKSRFIKKDNILKTQEFFEKHGNKTIVLARFVPIVRTFAPFLAGCGHMPYKKFISYNAIGGFLWVTIFVFLGYFFGSVPIIKDNLSLLVIGIILISVIPIAVVKIKSMLTKKA